MPVAKRRAPRAEEHRAGQVRTEELTYDRASAARVVRTDVVLCPFSGRISFGGVA